MREMWSIRLVALTGVLIVALAVGFACGQNSSEQPAAASPEPAAAAAAPAAADDPIAMGKQVYERERCSRCHSIAGEGSPRSPLDGIGSKRSEAEITDWIIAPESLKDEMAPAAFRAKQAFGQLPQADLDAMTAYLASLK